MGSLAKIRLFILIVLAMSWSPRLAANVQIDLTQLRWHIQLGLHENIDEGQDHLVIQKFPIHFSRLYPDLPPGVYTYTLGTTFFLTEDQTHDILVLSLEAIGEQWKVFINGHLVHDSWPQPINNGARQVLRYTRGERLPLAPSMLQAGENHLILQMQGRHGESGIFFNYFNGLSKSHYTLETLQNLKIPGTTLIRYGFFSALLFCGCMFVYVHFRMRAWNYFLYAGFFLIFISAYFMVYDSTAYQFFHDTTQLMRLQAFFMFPLSSFAILFIHNYFMDRKPLSWFTRLLVGVPLIFAVLGPILELGWQLQMLRIWQVCAVLTVISMWHILLASSLEKNQSAHRDDARLFLFFNAMGGVAAILDITLSILQIPMVRLTPVSAISICIFLIVSLLNNLRRYENSLKAANQALLDEKAAIQRFVPYEILQTLGHSSLVQLKLGDQTLRRMTILFADIRSFTSMSEAMGPQETFNFINAYLSRVGPVIRRHHGFIDKYIGDGIMALFPNSADDAVAAAMELQREVALFNEERKAQRFDGIKVGIGIHIGDLMLGTIGEAERFEGTVISDAVNVASRVEHLTVDFSLDILMTEDVARELKTSLHEQRFVGYVQVKGKASSIGLCEIFGHLDASAIHTRLSSRESLQHAIEAWQANDPTASQHFADLDAQLPGDGVIEYYQRLLEADRTITAQLKAKRIS